MNLGLEEFNKSVFKPNTIEVFQHYFLSQGVSLRDFNELPIPYIISMAMTEAYFRKKERDEMKKSSKRGK